MAEIKVNRETPSQQNDEPRGDLQRSTRPDWGRRQDVYLWPFGRSSDFAMNPFALIRRMNEQTERGFLTPWSGLGASETSRWSPDVEVYERDGKLIVHADLPGMSKDDVKIEVVNGELVIQGERKREHEEEQGGIHRSERIYGSFYRTVSLPDGAHIDQATAQFNNGVLEVRIPIPEAQRARQIPIGTEPAERKQAGAETMGSGTKSKVG